MSIGDRNASGSATTPFTAEQLLRRRDAILDAVARCAELMAGSRPHAEFADEALRILGEATGVSRVYVFELKRFTAGKEVVSQRYEWAAPSVEPQIDNPDLQSVDMVDAGYARWLELLHEGKPVVGDIAQFPASERPMLEAQEILSLLAQPVFVGSRLWGFMGFDACARQQSWEKVEVDALRIAAFAFGASIQRQERDQQIVQMQRLEAMGRMAGGIAHDFNNVLLVLSGSLEAMRDEAAQAGVASSGFLSYAEVADTALAQGQRLTRRLLEFSRQRLGTPVDVDVRQAVERIAPLLRQAVGSGCRMDIRCAEGTPQVRIDPVQVEQILLNLVVNARDAMPSGGTVRIEVDTIDTTDAPAADIDLAAGVFVRLRVTDTGIGIPEELHGRIFEPFFTTKADKGGTGLGLSTVYAIVTGCGGRVFAHNGKHGGAEFVVCLPGTCR